MMKRLVLILYLLIPALVQAFTPESELLVIKGVALIKRGDPLAIMMLNQAISVDPQNPAPYYYLGYFYMKQGDIENAINSFEAAKSLDSENRYYPLYLQLGKLYLLKGEFRKALNSLKKYFRFVSSDPIAEFYLALADMYVNGNLEEKIFDRASLLLPELRDVANYFTALNYLHLLKDSDTIEWLKKTIAITDDPEILTESRRYLYYLENKGKNFKNYGVVARAGAGYDTDPLREGKSDQNVLYSMMRLKAYYITSPGKSQFGVHEKFFSRYFFKPDYSAGRRFYSRTSLTYFHTSGKFKEALSIFYRYNSFGGELRNDYGGDIFVDFSQGILNVFRMGGGIFSYNISNWVNNGFGFYAYMNELFLFDAGRSNGYIGTGYWSERGGYFSRQGPYFELSIDKNMVGGLYLGLWTRLSAEDYPDFPTKRNDTILCGELSLYYRWLGSIELGATYGMNRTLSYLKNVNEKWLVVWLGGYF